MHNAFNLLIGNEGVVLAGISRGRVVKHAYAARQDSEALQGIANYLREKDAKALTVIVDLLEQSYRLETLPAVNLLDRKKLIARRLDKVFGNTELCAALLLRGSAAGEATPAENKEDAHHGASYLFAALQDSEEWLLWKDWIDGLGIPVTRLSLLPIEAKDMAKALLGTASPQGAPAVTQAQETTKSGAWTLMVSRHASGGIRQIITHKGHLALTRLTPDIDMRNKNTAAEDIRAEIDASLDYIKRLGYSSNEGLDILLLDEDIAQILEKSGSITCRSITGMTPQSAAEKLGLGDVLLGDATDNFGDLLMLAWAARRSRPVLNLQRRDIRREGREKLWSKTGFYSQIAAALIILGFFAQQVHLSMTLKDETMQFEEDAARLNTLAEQMLREDEGLPVSPAFMNESFAAHAEMTAGIVPPQLVMEQLQAVLPQSARLRDLTWQEGELQPSSRRNVDNSRQSSSARQYALRITLIMDEYSDPEAARLAAEQLRQVIAGGFPASSVEMTRLPLDADPGNRFIDTSENGNNRAWAENPTVDITISGDNEALLALMAAEDGEAL